MFQVAFLSTFVASHVENPARLEEAYGFPIREDPADKPVEQAMVETIKGIYSVSSWPEFFEKVCFNGGQRWGEAKLSQVLRDCIRKSETAGYHVRCRSMKALQDNRRQNEKVWAEASRKVHGKHNIRHM